MCQYERTCGAVSGETEDHRVRVAAQRRQRMRAQLCDAALRVMADSGPDAATVDAIVQAAGVSRGTFYKYFDAPADLIREVGIELAQEMIVTVGPVLQGHDDPAVRLSQGFRIILTLVRAEPVLGRFLIRAGWPVTDTVAAFSAQVVANLTEGLALGRFRQVPLAVAEALVGGLSIGMMRAVIAPGADPGLESKAAVTLLMALGLDDAEAASIAILPLLAVMLADGGLVARARTRV